MLSLQIIERERRETGTVNYRFMDMANIVRVGALSGVIRRCDGCGYPARDLAEPLEKAGRFCLPLRWFCPSCFDKWPDDDDKPE